MKKTILAMAVLTAFYSPVYSDPSSSEQTTITPAPSTTQPTQDINCKYHIPASTTTVDPIVLETWAEKAAMQTFSFDPAQIDAQLEKLQLCFTEQGWIGYKDALDKSGNLKAIKEQNLTVSNEKDGKTTVETINENQWKIKLPLHVVYQNDKEKLSQLLSVELLVGRKVSGDLGIMQIIATPAESKALDTSTTPESTAEKSEAEPKQP